MSRFYNFLIVAVLCFFSINLAYSQVDSTLQKPTFAVLPVVYFTPETSWAFGGGAVTNFRLGKDTVTYESQVALGGVYTLFNQILTFTSFRIFTPQNKNLIAGEAGWYDFLFFYYGVGPDVTDADEEIYEARLPRIRFDYLRKVGTHTFAGLRLHYEDFTIKSTEPGGLVATSGILGSDGGRNSGIGPMFYYDSRDSQIYPSSGIFAESSLQVYDRFTGSNFSYVKWIVDFRKVVPVRENQIFVYNAYSEILRGDVPFFGMPLMGGNRRMRGLFEGKFRDNNMMVLQGEYRYKFAKRWGVTGFGGVGNVYSNRFPFDFGNTKVTYGAGGRFQLSKREKLNLRLDLAHSPGEDMRIYLTFGEAF